ncbi:MAG: hypothetical protein IM509_05410 [Microcystis sp. M31BS1]|uniref:hypothetical protein n=1 Tax=Microcystis sp. M31BS1 TaxID=2771186 RepID=UPI002590D0A7|nr:hypothetical protein [Microcystis sp. M31BS1]MCA2590188.1 hypothetical protein [Microcystis sp. M31BS1]
MKLTKEYLSQWLEAIRDGYAVTVVEPEEALGNKWIICVENPKWDGSDNYFPVLAIEVPE